MFYHINPRPFLNTHRYGKDRYLPYLRQDAIDLFEKQYCEFVIEKNVKQIDNRSKFQQQRVYKVPYQGVINTEYYGYEA